MKTMMRMIFKPYAPLTHDVPVYPPTQRKNITTKKTTGRGRRQDEAVKKQKGKGEITIKEKERTWEDDGGTRKIRNLNLICDAIAGPMSSKSSACQRLRQHRIGSVYKTYSLPRSSKT